MIAIAVATFSLTINHQPGRVTPAIVQVKDKNMTAKIKASEKQESIDILRDWLKPGSTVYCVVKHVARSGMQRNIQAIAIEVDPTAKAGVHTYNLAWHISRALGWSFSQDDNAVKVGGCGMDMGWHMVDCLSRTLYPDADKDSKLECQWL